MTPLFIIPLSVFIVSLLCYWGVLWLFPRVGLLDFPERYGHKRPPIPYPAGIVSVLLFCLLYVFIEPNSLQKAGVLVAVLLLGIVCSIDDRRPLPPAFRATVQFFVALLVFATGTRIYSLTNPLQILAPWMGGIVKLDTLIVHVPHLDPLPIVSGIFTVIWLGMTMNALNWFDGISGQVSILSTIAFLTIGVLSLSERVNQPGLALIAFVLAGISAGSILFDLPPPKLLIGDTGAMFYGLMIGILTIYTGGKVATAFLVLGVPLIDAVIVVIRRIGSGKSIAQGNAIDEHLHHRLLRKGWTPRQVILLTATIGVLFGLSALFLDTTEKFLAALLLGLLMILLHLYSKPISPPPGRVGLV